MLAERSGFGALSRSPSRPPRALAPSPAVPLLAMPIERIAIEGFAEAAVRTNLCRKAAKDTDRIKGRKFVIRCFSVREVSESPSGRPKIPVQKKLRFRIPYLFGYHSPSEQKQVPGAFFLTGRKTARLCISRIRTIPLRVALSPKGKNVPTNLKTKRTDLHLSDSPRRNLYSKLVQVEEKASNINKSYFSFQKNVESHLILQEQAV